MQYVNKLIKNYTFDIIKQIVSQLINISELLHMKKN